jgi:predicted transcriptional regulator
LKENIRTLEQAIIDVNMVQQNYSRKVAIPEDLLYRLIEDLKKAQEDYFIPSTEELIKEAEKYLYE